MANIYEDVETLKTQMAQVQAISDGAAYSADKWFPIHHTFLID